MTVNPSGRVNGYLALTAWVTHTHSRQLATLPSGRSQVKPERSDKNSWPHLVIANGIMYVRDQDVLLAYDARDAR
jgi:hypothetical protein